MTWRRFSTLLRGLGPNSASASRAFVRRHGKGGSYGGRGEPVTTVSGTKEQVSSVFVSMFGNRGKKD